MEQTVLLDRKGLLDLLVLTVQMVPSDRKDPRGLPDPLDLLERTVLMVQLDLKDLLGLLAQMELTVL